MKNILRKMIQLCLSLVFLLTIIPLNIYAQENFTIVESELDGFEYVKYDKPIKEIMNGREALLLGYLKPINAPLELTQVKYEEIIKPMDYYEYDIYKVYDNGIVEHWSYLSNPYFIMSIARGMEYEKSTEVSATISASYEGSYPAAAKTAINSQFGFSASGTKKVTEKITLSGPDEPYSSRDFYYQKGRNINDVLIVQEHRSNWDGVLWTDEYEALIGVPAIRHYSEDTR